MLLNLTKPFQKVTLGYLAEELSLTCEEVEGLLVDMILDERIAARIDQIKGHLVLLGPRSGDGGTTSLDRRKAECLGRWADALASVTDSFGSRFE